MSIMAEQSVIGSLLMNQECIADVYSILEPQMFTDELFGKVYHEYRRHMTTTMIYRFLTLNRN